MGIRGRTYFLGAHKDKYLTRCETDGMRQKEERLKKLVRLLPNDGQGRFDMGRLLVSTVAARAPKVAKQCWTHSSPLGSKGCFDAAIPICGRSGAFDKEYLCEEPYWGISSSSPRSRSWRPRATATTFQNTARFQSRAGVGWAAQMHAVNDPS